MINQPRVTVAPKPKRLVPTTITFTVTALARCLGIVLHAAAVDEGRPILNGVRFEPVGGTWHVVACDNYRIADQNTSVKYEGKPSGFTIALASIKDVLALPFMKKPDAYGGPREVTITTDIGKRGPIKVLTAMINNDRGFLMGLTVIDGEYPNWQTVANGHGRKRPKAVVAVSAAFLAEVCKAVSQGRANKYDPDPVIIEVWDTLQPVRITTRRGGGLIETLMPIRIAPQDMPGWKPAPPARETGQPSDKEDGGEEEVHDAA